MRRFWTVFSVLMVIVFLVTGFLLSAHVFLSADSRIIDTGSVSGVVLPRGVQRLKLGRRAIITSWRRKHWRMVGRVSKWFTP